MGERMASFLNPKWRAMLAPIALASSFAFLLATNYCNLEAFAAHPAHSENSSDHHSAGDHHGAAPTSDDEALCCETLHAVPVSKVDVTPNTLIRWVNLATVEIAERDVLIPPARSSIGWSPPERGPTPAAPFYRTTYANHAPPGYPASLTL